MYKYDYCDAQEKWFCEIGNPDRALAKLKFAKKHPLRKNEKLTVLADADRLDSYDFKKIRKLLGSTLSHVIVSPVYDDEQRFHENLFANEPMGDDDAFYSEEEQQKLFGHKRNPFAEPTPPFSTRLRKAISKRIPHRRHVYQINDVSKNKSHDELYSFSNRARRAFSDLRHRIPLGRQIYRVNDV